MIAKDLLPWMYVKRAATWTPYVRVRCETVRCEPASLSVKAGSKPGRRPPRG